VHVVRVEGAGLGEPAVRLVDEQGQPVAEVDGFLRLLAVREYSPNTVRAYAHDLQKLFAFLAEAGIPAAEFTLARAMEFLQWLRLVSSSRRAQRLELGAATSGGRVLSAKTCNRVMAAVSSFYEFLIASEGYAGRDNPVVKVADQAAARVPGRYRPPLDNAGGQRPVRRMLRVKTIEALPRPMTAQIYAALLGELRSRRDRALLEVMWEGGLRPGEVLGLQLEDISYGRRRITVRKRDDHPRRVRQKSRRDRVVDLLEGHALPALSDYVMYERPAGADCPWVFLVGGKGKRRCEPPSAPWCCGPTACPASGAGCAVSACGWMLNGPRSTASPSSPALTWSTSWNRSARCGRSSIPARRSARPPRRHHLHDRGVLPLRRTVRMGRRPGPAADHPRGHAAPRPASSPVHPRSPARPGDGPHPGAGMPAAALRAADRPVERRPPPGRRAALARLR
jgi:integrase/recombinase XerD